MAASAVCALICAPLAEIPPAMISCLIGCLAAVDVGLLDPPADHVIPYQDISELTRNVLKSGLPCQGETRN